MPDSTSRGYPYPLPVDSINVPRDMQALAEAIDEDVAASYATGMRACRVRSTTVTTQATWTRLVFSSFVWYTDVEHFAIGGDGNIVPRDPGLYDINVRVNGSANIVIGHSPAFSSGDNWLWDGVSPALMTTGSQGAVIGPESVPHAEVYVYLRNGTPPIEYIAYLRRAG